MHVIAISGDILLRAAATIDDSTLGNGFASSFDIGSLVIGPEKSRPDVYIFGIYKSVDGASYIRNADLSEKLSSPRYCVTTSLIHESAQSLLYVSVLKSQNVVRDAARSANSWETATACRYGPLEFF